MLQKQPEHPTIRIKFKGLYKRNGCYLTSLTCDDVDKNPIIVFAILVGTYTIHSSPSLCFINENSIIYYVKDYLGELWWSDSKKIYIDDNKPLITKPEETIEAIILASNIWLSGGSDVFEISNGKELQPIN